MSEVNPNPESNVPQSPGVEPAAADVQDVQMSSPARSSPLSSAPVTPTATAASTSAAPTGTTSTTTTTTGTNLKPVATANTENLPVLFPPRLLDLVREVDATAQLDEDVEDILQHMVDDFLEETVRSTCAYARHRKVNKVEVRDIQLHLERKWNMWIPGFGTDELRPYKRASMTEAHKQRLALIRKTIKKY